MAASKDRSKLKPQTRLALVGRNTEGQHGFVNPAVYHGSTVLFPDVATLASGNQLYTYGRRRSPTIDALAGAVAEIEGAAGAVLAPSGLCAVSLAFLALVEAGDHVLVADCVYEPTRHFCDTALTRLGVSVEYYDPLVGSGIDALLRPNTRLVFMESPGSLTFEVQDVPAIAAAARAHGAYSILDNTWASPLFFRPLEHGVDVSLAAGTKYLAGHSDVLIGTVAANEHALPKVRAAHGALGLHVGPDDVYLALRGLRTLAVRLERQQASALKVACWLKAQPKVSRVLYPALESDPGHAIWRRDFTGASSLFGAVLDGVDAGQAAAFLDSLTLFGLGYSWGGFESLAIPTDPARSRVGSRWKVEGSFVRFHIGLEDPDDLIADLVQGLERLSSDAAVRGGVPERAVGRGSRSGR